MISIEHKLGFVENFLILHFSLSRILAKNGFSDEELSQQRPVVYSNTIGAMISILKGMDALQIVLGNPAKQVRSELKSRTVMLSDFV